AALHSVGASPRGRRVALRFARRVEAPVTVDVFQQSIGRRITEPRLVARFRNRTRPFTWNGRSNRPGRRVRNGYLFVRYALRLPDGSRPSRRVTLRRARGRFTRGPDFHRPDTCGLLESFKMRAPVFGGRTRRPLTLGFRVRERATVGIVVLRGRRVVHRFREGERAGGRLFRVGLRARGLRRGLYRVRITARRGGEVARVTLAARKL
ncbi:MAG: hypothetical protein M3389_00595, partial [Actinomycetota bacterium]|nr:hypothetical protein [Actinomycetota bacterium]